MMYKKSSFLRSLATSQRQIAFTSLAFLCIILGGTPAGAFSWNVLLPDPGYASAFDGIFPDGTRYRSVVTGFQNVGQLNGPAVLLRQGDDFNASIFLSGTAWSFPPDTISSNVQLEFSPINANTFSYRGGWSGKMSLYLGSNLLIESQSYGNAYDAGSSSNAFNLGSSFGPANGSPIEIGGLTFDSVIFEGKYGGDQPAVVRFADVNTYLYLNSYTAVPEPSTQCMALAGLACGGYSLFRRRKRVSSYRLLLLAAIVTVTVATAATPVFAQSVNYELVPVGDAGNAADTTGYGAVPYEYQIGKYEVTIGQYAAFLNAVAKDDPHLVYNPLMYSLQGIAGIARSGSSGSYAYSVVGPFGDVQIPQATPENRPIALVNFFNAARFANWMSNGQPTGAQEATTTENGAYAISGTTTTPAKNTVNPNTGLPPSFCIASENEWYKSAYYKGGSANAGYWKYATQSDADPGNFVGSGSNQANYYLGFRYSVTQAPGYSTLQNYLTDVGAFTNSKSFYGTFGQSGNVYEWIDVGDGLEFAFARGGGFNNGFADQMSSTSRFQRSPSEQNDGGGSGFRLAAPAAVPEPSTYAMALAGLAFGGYSLFRRRKQA